MVRVFFIGILIASVILLFGLWFSLAGFDPRRGHQLPSQSRTHSTADSIDG